MQYQEFLKTKEAVVPICGFDPDPKLWCPQAKEFQVDISGWAVRRGRAAIWADTGLGKTLMMLMWGRQVLAEVNKPIILFSPLAVGPQTCREAVKFGIPDVEMAESAADIKDNRIYVTNYQKLHRFDTSVFCGVILDESQILRSHTGKYRTELIERFAGCPYRLSCTATPSPNDYEEIGNQAEFLGVCTRLEMLATYFHHDSSNTADWILKGHAERAFWQWVGSWACVIRKPSDLGYEDEGYNLPPLRVHEVVIDTPATQGSLVPVEAQTLSEQREAKRDSLAERVATVANLVNGSSDQWLIWCDLNAEGDALEEAIPTAVQVAGSDDDDVKVERMLGFTDGKYQSLISKSRICGYGMNWQHCSKMAFVGATDSFEAYYQSVRRCWRYGQKNPVDVYVVFSDREYSIWRRNLDKQKRHDDMIESMLKYTAEVNREAIKGGVRTQDEYQTDVKRGDNWTLFLGDTCEYVKHIPDNSIDFSVFSPPFSSLYTYSASTRDMGNSRDNDIFFRHFTYAAKEWYRILRPGRLMAIHCCELPLMKERNGYIGIDSLPDDIWRVLSEIGFIKHSPIITIWKDPVVEQQRTKAIGLLHKQVVKDSAMSRVGIPDRLLVVRKPGQNEEPVDGCFRDYYGWDDPVDEEYTGDHDRMNPRSVEVWQRYASPVWFDIRQSKVLNNYKDGRVEEDDRHIAPLQLDVIARAVDLWSNPGDTVFSPFAGIGSEGYQSLLMGRKFVGIELKKTYFDIAVKNLQHAAKKAAQVDLFAEVS